MSRASRQRTIRRALVALLPSLALPAAAFGQCPPVEQTAETMKRVFKTPVEVKRISPSPVKGLCEIRFVVQGQPNILYTDPAGGYFLYGQVLEAASGKNLTREALDVLTALSADDLKRLEALTAITVGAAGTPVYFVTDPQ